MMSATDSRFKIDERFTGEAEAESSQSAQEDEESDEGEDDENILEGEGYAGPAEKIVKPLTPEALAAFQAIQNKAGVVYISRIPPGMRPTKVRHLMGQHGEIGRVYLQQEDAKRAYLRRKHTSTKKAHFTEGWVEFKDKKIGRITAEMLNAQPIGGKKGTRWRDDVWTMKYLPKFKWDMLTEQVAHEAAIHAARLRVELSHSRSEQHDYLKNVELARVLDKRAQRKKDVEDKNGEGSERKDKKKDATAVERVKEKKRPADTDEGPARKKRVKPDVPPAQLNDVLGSIF